MNEYFCVLPFYGAEYHYNASTTTPCCLLPTDTNIKELQENMLAGIKPSACNKCWQLESQGKISDRQIKNSSYDVYANRDISLVFEDCKNGKFSNQIVKLYTSTVCNSTCMTCSPCCSSAWATLKGFPVSYTSLSDEKLNSIDYTNLKMLSFVGGEPLYERKNFEILKKLLEVNNTDCFISLVTNGSVVLTDYQINILKKFKNLNFCLSIDGTGPVFEYVRYPLKWNTLTSNINLYRELGIQLSVSYTISNLNILYHSETISWFNANNLGYNHNVVTHPVWFSPNSLPLKVKEEIEAKELLSPHCEQDDINFKLFLKNITEQDTLKGISIIDYLPKLAKLII